MSEGNYQKKSRSIKPKGGYMKKHVAKTISIVSLFVTLLVSASTISAFPITVPWITDSGYRTRSSVSAQEVSPSVQSTQDVGTASAQETTDVDAQPDGDVNLIALFWVQLVVCCTQLP
jgi:hypothetical protein